MGTAVTYLRVLRDQRSLVRQLFRREFSAGYRRSYLGLAWVVATPLLSALTWLLLHDSGVVVSSDFEVSYAAYLLTGTLFFGLIRGVAMAVRQSVMGANQILLSVNFPREVLLIKQSLVALAQFAASAVVSLCIVALIEAPPTPESLVALPLLIIPTAAAVAVGVVLAVLVVLVADLERVLDLIWGFLYVASGVIYRTGGADGVLGTISDWNPLTYLVAMPRDAYLGLDTPSLAVATGCALASAGALALALRLFAVAHPHLIERLV